MMDIARENEKTKLEILLLKVQSISEPHQRNITELDQIFANYTFIINKLNNHSPETFGNLLNYDRLKILKKRGLIGTYAGEKLIRLAFDDYKEHISHSIETAIFGLSED